MSTIKVISCDDRTFDVARDIIRLSNTINTLLQDLGIDENAALTEAIPLPNVTGETFDKVLEYCKYHKNDHLDAEVSRKRAVDGLSAWDNTYMQMDNATLYDVILAANYLDVKGLSDICAQTVANMIRGKNPQEIRNTFNIENDFSPEEEEQIRRENAWMEE